MYHGSKSDLIDELIATTSISTTNESPSSDAAVVDGPAIVHMLAPANGSTVDDYCELYLAYVKKYFSVSKRVDIIFDVYLEHSLKEGIQKTQGVAPPIIVRGILQCEIGTVFFKMIRINKPDFNILLHLHRLFHYLKMSS